MSSVFPKESVSVALFFSFHSPFRTDREDVPVLYRRGSQSGRAHGAWPFQVLSARPFDRLSVQSTLYNFILSMYDIRHSNDLQISPLPKIFKYIVYMYARSIRLLMISNYKIIQSRIAMRVERSRFGTRICEGHSVASTLSTFKRLEPTQIETHT